MEAYEAECRRAEGMERDAILAELGAIAESDEDPRNLSVLHGLMVTVEALADTYRGHDAWDHTYLLDALMRCHERFRDWLGAYA
jgi:hypothetical protein